MSAEQADVIAAAGLGALVSSRILWLLGMTTAVVDDQALVPVWVDMMTALIGQVAGGP